MSVKYISSNWRLPNQENSSKSDNYGLTFDGTEYLTSSVSNLNSAYKFSVSFWAKKPTSGNEISIGDRISTYQGMWLNWYSDGNVYFSVRRSLNESMSYAFSFDTDWHYFVGTFDNGVAKLYIDNSLVSTFTFGTTYLPATTGDNFKIGAIDASTIGTGSISEVAIFDYALSSTQISTLYGSSELGSTSPMALKPQPISYYPLGDNSASNPLTQPNEAVEDASVFDFDGGTDCINIPDSSILKPSTISVSIWFKGGNQPSNFSYLLAKRYSTGGPAYGFYTGASLDKLSFIIRKGDNSGWAETNINDSGVVMDNNWHNAVGIFDGTNVKLYIDGVLKSTTTTGVSGITYGSGHLTIGALLNTGSLDFNGELSNVAIWNSDQSSEISNIYNSGVPATSYTNTPTAWYKLDQSANWEADSSGNWQIPDAVSAYPQSFDFDGSNNYINCGDSDDFSFGNGVTDNPFSLSAWVKIQDATNFRIILKGDGSNNMEYFLGTDSSDRVFLNIYDQTSGNRTGRMYGTTLTFYEGQWIHLAATYDGSGSNTGIKLYLNKTRVDNTSIGAGSYTAMHNTTQPLYIGRYASGYANGKFSNVQVFNTELPATGTDSVETLYNNGVPLTTAIASDNLKLWAKLDNTATFSTNWSIPDASGNGNTGTSSGMTEQNLVNNNVSVLNGESSGMTSANLVLSDLTRAVPYGDGYSFYLDGTGDYVDVASSTIGTGYTEFSVSAWAKFDGSSVYECIASVDGVGGRVWQLFQWSSNRGLAFQLFNNSGTGAVTPVNSFINASNTWYHVVGTYDGSNIRLYVNGNLEATVAQTGTVRASTAENFKIGSNGYNEDLEGYVNNVSIYDKALTSTEVLKLYSNGVPQNLENFNPQPVAFYPLGSNSFWNGSQWTVRDMIGSNDGTGQNIGIDGLVGDSPRSSANGTGTNMDVPSNLVGTTKWSDNNSWSINMSETARVEDTP